MDTRFVFSYVLLSLLLLIGFMVYLMLRVKTQYIPTPASRSSI